MILRIEPPEDLIRFRHEAMATDFTLSFGGVDARYAGQIALEAGRLIDTIEDKLSLYRENSDVTRFNLAKPGAALRVSQECIDCLTVAFRASAATRGRFNVFMGREATKAKGNIPSYLTYADRAAGEDAGDGAFLAMDPISRTLVKRRGGAMLDLGGIGKGFALDRVAELIEDWEAPRAMLSAGGSTLLLIAPPGDRSWTATVGDRRLEPFGAGCLSSSGLDFEERHIIDPDTRLPAALWKRAYAWAGQAGFADALTTACMLMPWEEIQQLARDEAELSLAAVSVGGEWRTAGPFFEPQDNGHG